jgi:hypothetical protein
MLYMDISSIRTPSKGNKKFWVLFVDAYSKCAMSRFLRYKSELVKVGLEFLQHLTTQGINVRTIRCDNAAENRQLEIACRKKTWHSV